MFNGLLLPDCIDLSSPNEYDNLKEYDYFPLKKESKTIKIVSKQIFSDDECNEIIKLGKSFKKIESKMGGFEDSGFRDDSYRSSYQSWIKPNNLSLELYTKLAELVNSVNESVYNFDLKIIENLQYTEYPFWKKGHYGMHMDCSDMSAFYGLTRKISFSIQLSNPEKYEGGDLVFHSAGMTESHASRERGSITFFPSFLMHEVLPVTSGTRYSLVGWVHGPKWK